MDVNEKILPPSRQSLGSFSPDVQGSFLSCTDLPGYLPSFQGPGMGSHIQGSIFATWNNETALCNS